MVAGTDSRSGTYAHVHARRAQRRTGRQDRTGCDKSLDIDAASETWIGNAACRTIDGRTGGFHSHVGSEIVDRRWTHGARGGPLEAGWSGTRRVLPSIKDIMHKSHAIKQQGVQSKARGPMNVPQCRICCQASCTRHQAPGTKPPKALAPRRPHAHQGQEHARSVPWPALHRPARINSSASALVYGLIQLHCPLSAQLPCVQHRPVHETRREFIHAPPVSLGLTGWIWSGRSSGQRDSTMQERGRSARMMCSSSQHLWPCLYPPRSCPQAVMIDTGQAFRTLL